MPLYEYHCEECQNDFTLLQPASVNKEETTCESCGSVRVAHKFSTFASKVQGSPSSRSSKPVTEKDYPNKDVFKLPIPRLRSEL